MVSSDCKCRSAGEGMILLEHCDLKLVRDHYNIIQRLALICNQTLSMATKRYKCIAGDFMKNTVNVHI